MAESPARLVPIWLSRLLVAATALFAGLYGARPITTWDFWWHVRSGQEILATRSLPATDSFSHTAGDALWVNHEWLFDVILYPVWIRLGGFPIRIAFGLIAAATILLVAAIARRWTRSDPLTALLTLAFLGLYFGNIQIRPQVLSYPFFLWIFDRYFFRERPPGKGLLAGTAALMIFWANIHAVALLPVIFYVAYLVAESLSPSLSRMISILEAPPASRLGWKAHLVPLGVIFACTFASPNGWRLHEYALKGSSIASTFVNEWQPFYFRYTSNRNLPFEIYATVLAALVLYGLHLLAHAIRRVRLDGAETAMAVTTFYFVITGRRWLWLAIIPMTIALRNGSPLRGILSDLAGSGRVWRPWAAAGATALTSVVLIQPYFAFRPVRQAWETMESGDYLHAYVNSAVVPSGAVNVIREAGLRGNLFNFYGWGGYLLYTLYPQCRVFIDGRAVLFPERVIQDSVAISRRAPNAADLLESYRVDLAVMPPEWTPPERAAGGWVAYFRGRTSAIHGRIGSENLSRIRSYYEARKIEFGPPDGFVEAAAAEADPAWVRAHDVLSEDLMKIVVPLYDKIHGFYAGKPEGEMPLRQRLAENYLKAGLGASAARELRIAYSLDPKDRFTALNLANVEVNLGRREVARRVLLDHLEVDPADEQARALLGRIGP